MVDVLEPLWHTPRTTASRLRGRIEAVLDAAKVGGEREGENAARWKGHLDKLLSSRRAGYTVAHDAALTYSDLPTFIASLREHRASRPRRFGSRS